MIFFSRSPAVSIRRKFTHQPVLVDDRQRAGLLVADGRPHLHVSVAAERGGQADDRLRDGQVEVPANRVPGLNTNQRAAHAHPLPGAGVHVADGRDSRRRGRGLLAVLVVHHRGRCEDGTVHGRRGDARDHLHADPRQGIRRGRVSVRNLVPVLVVLPSSPVLYIKRSKYILYSDVI